MDGGSTFTKVVGFLAEAGMIVFAVMVALGVEEWRADQGLQDFAVQVQIAVLAEMEANLTELHQTAASLDSAQTMLGRVIAEEDMSLLGSALNLSLPEISTAAWRSAQASEAGPHLDYDWVIQVARAYEAYEVSSRVSDDLISAMGEIIGRGASIDRVGAVYGPLVILTNIHGQVAERFEAILDDESAEPGS